MKTENVQKEAEQVIELPIGYCPTIISKGVIKKYANRKLYDTAKHAYINLSDILDMVRGGRSITVFCCVSKTDITAETLTTAIFEESVKKAQYAPIPRLFEIIRNGGLK